MTESIAPISGVSPSTSSTSIVERVYSNGKGKHVVDRTIYVVTLYDANGDGVINVMDVILVVNLILGISDLDCSIDYDDDDIVNVIDVIIMINIILEGE